MHFAITLVLYGMLQAAAPALAGCAADNCLRAIRASAFPTRPGTADCSSYFSTTVTPGVSTAITVIPTSIPAYASPCSGSVRYSSACSCIGIAHATTTATPTITVTTTSTTSTTTLPSNTLPSGEYIIVSPTNCPAAKPTGTLLGQSNSSFSEEFGGLQYSQYSNSQFIISNDSVGPFFVDLSNPDCLTISDEDGDTLIICANGTFEAFAGDCELEIVGTLPGGTPSRKSRRNDLYAIDKRQSAELCNDVQIYCNSRIGVILNGAAGGALCIFLGGEIGSEIGGGIGFLGNLLGPEVGIPTTLLGTVLGARLGAFLASKIGSILCSGATSLLGDQLCKACPTQVQCGAGQISCNNGPCQDALSDPNNCGAYGVVCPSGICQNGQCSAQVCDGSVCGSLNSCGGDCFCFEDADNNGFCGPDVPCAPLAGCDINSDCDEGEVCAVGTCCGVNVCLGSCASDMKRSLLFGRNITELWTAGQKSV